MCCLSFSAEKPNRKERGKYLNPKTYYKRLQLPKMTNLKVKVYMFAPSNYIYVFIVYHSVTWKIIMNVETFLSMRLFFQKKSHRKLV